MRRRYRPRYTRKFRNLYTRTPPPRSYSSFLFRLRNMQAVHRMIEPKTYTPAGLLRATGWGEFVKYLRPY